MTLDREVDWVIKHRLLERYADRRGIPMSDPRMSMMDLSYHDVDRKRGLYYLLEAKGLVDRVTDEKVALAVRQPADDEGTAAGPSSRRPKPASGTSPLIGSTSSSTTRRSAP